MAATIGTLQVKGSILIHLDGREPIALGTFTIPAQVHAGNPVNVSLMGSSHHLGLTADIAAALHQAADQLANR